MCPHCGSELGRSYLTVTKDVTRVRNRIKTLYRSWAIPCSGTRVYAATHHFEISSAHAPRPWVTP